MKIDHIAIAVNNVEESAKVYQKALGINKIEFETVESEGVKVAIIPMENGRIELIQPTKDDSPIKNFLDKKGPGLHHMALETDKNLMPFKLNSVKTYATTGEISNTLREVFGEYRPKEIF